MYVKIDVLNFYIGYLILPIMRFFSILLKFSKDLIAVILIAGFASFLLGSYLQGEYLFTGYPDWMYHAYRVKSLMVNGLSSWEFGVANGLSQWRAYQYIPHFLTLFVQVITGASITKSMLILTFLVFLVVKVGSYIGMRLNNIGLIAAFIASVISFDFLMQYHTMGDYSIYIASVLLPLLIFVWIQSFESSPLLYIFSALAGLAWTFHPVLGFIFSGLLVITWLLRFQVLGLTQVIIQLILFIFASAPFSIAYLTLGYSFANPLFSTTAFLRITTAFPYLNFSLTYIGMIIFSFGVIFWKNTLVPHWTKILLLYSCGIIFMSWLGVKGFTPALLNQFQYTRGLLFIGFILPFVFAKVIDVFLSQTKGKFLYIVVGIFLGVVIVADIETASTYSGSVGQSNESLVNNYFKTKPIPFGLVYSPQAADEIYFTYPKVKFVTSYNDHQLPSPLSYRLKTLLKPDLGYTGVSSKNIETIYAYLNVLGVEYIFLPIQSPLAEALLQTYPNDYVSSNIFSKTGEGFVVIRKKQPVSFGYLLEKSETDQLAMFEPLGDPTLQSSSYQVWDNSLVNLSQALTTAQKVNIQFDSKNNQIVANLDNLDQFEQPILLLAQNYQKDWQVKSHPNLVVKPSNLKLQTVDLSQIKSQDKAEIVLAHAWPQWYWPVQALGFITILTTSIGLIIWLLIPSKKQLKQKEPK